MFETIVGVAAGIWMLDEQLHEEPWGVALSIASLVVVIGGLVALSRSQGAAEAGVQPDPDPVPAG